MSGSRVLWVVAVCSVLGLAAVAVPVSGLFLGHSPLSPDARSHGSGSSWSSNNSSVRYSVTFTESGLPTGTWWSVALVGARAVAPSAAAPTVGAPGWHHRGGNRSNTSTIGFSLPNGSYGFSVGGAASNGTVYVPTPSAGSVDVNGSNLSVSVSYAPLTLYTVSFVETGLPANTSWSVVLISPHAWGPAAPEAAPAWHGGGWNASNGSTVNFTVANGSYGFSVPNASGPAGTYAATPAAGNFSVNGSNVTVDVAFAVVPYFTVTFAENGLPAGTFWSVVLSGAFGGHSYGRGPYCGESGFNGSTNATVTFTVPDGNYSFFVGNTSNGSSLYAPSPASGNLSVNGSGVTVDVTFSLLAVYTVSFEESGLPSGTNWSVAFGSWGTGYSWNLTNGSYANFTAPNGTYSFAVWTAFANGTIYLPTPSGGTVDVNGSSVTVTVDFAPLVLYNVTFTESGLPNGTGWHVGVATDGWGWEFNRSSSGDVSFALPNGSFAFSVGPAWSNGTLYTASPSFGTLTVAGGPVTIDVTFTETD